MKAFFLVMTLVFFTLATSACPVCEKQQPKLLQGISHGTGPQSNWDYIIIWAMVIIVMLTLYFSIKLLVKPGERAEKHIKRTILTVEDGTEE